MEYKLVEAMHVGNSFPITTLLDSNGYTRYVEIPGSKNEKKFEQMKDRIESLSAASYEMYDFSLTELLALHNLDEDEAAPYMKPKGFFQKEKNVYNITTKQGEMMEITIADPVFEQDANFYGYTLLGLTDPGKYNIYQEKFLDAGYEMKETNAEKGTTTYSKGKISVTFTDGKKDGFPFEFMIENLK